MTFSKIVMNGIIGVALASFFLGGLFLQNAYAQGSGGNAAESMSGSGQNTTGSGQSTSGSGQNSGPPSKDKKFLENPLGPETTTIPQFLYKILDVLLTFAIPIVVLYIMYAGYLFVTASGNEGQISTAKNALLWAIVGGVIVLGAKLIVEVIQGTVAAF